MKDATSDSVPAHLVREELERIERSGPMRQSNQLRALLRHLVEHTLEGDGDRLKELALGIDVFRRPAESFDPRRDPIVRVEAGRLREKLARYYAEDGWNALVDIALPVGGYQPEFRLRPRPTQTGLTIPSLIVLPVQNLTGEPTNGAFCDALTDELIDAFARLPGLKVIARTTSFRYRDRHEDVRAIGRAVGAATLLESSLQQRGPAIRVIAQLVSTGDGAHLWSRTFDSSPDGLSALEQSLSDEIAHALQRQFSAHPAAHAWTAARRTLVRRGTGDPVARELHDQARALLRRIRAASQYRAIELFGAATRLDPAFALAHSGAGAAWTNLASMGVEPSRAAAARALEAAHRALAIDPELYEALSVKAWATYRDRLDPAAAELLYREGLRLNPSATYLRLGYAWLLAYTGRFEEARDEFALIRDLDPLDIGLRHNYGHFLMVARDYARAEEELARALEIEPDDLSSHLFLAEVALLKRHATQALAESGVALALAPGLVATRAIHALALHAAGRIDDACAAARELELGLAGGVPSVLPVAIMRAGMGDADRAFSWLEAAAGAHDVHLVAAPTHPLLDALHADARWPAWLARYGLPGVAPMRTGD